MRIRPDQLTASLSRNPPPLFVISGDEPLLKQESADQVRAHCRTQGYSERIILNADKSFDWGTLEEHMQSFSLFGEKQLLDLRLEALPNEAGKKVLKRWAETMPEDSALLISAAKIESSTLNTKWFKAIENHALHVQVWPLNPEQFPRWVGQRLQARGIKPTTDAVAALCGHVEGNLLAANQEIEKIALSGLQGTLDEAQIVAGLTASSRFTVFDLVDNCLKGDAKHAMKVVQTLEAENFEPSILLWALSKEVRTLAQLFRAKQSGQNVDAALQKMRVFKSKWRLYHQYLNKQRPSRLSHAHALCCKTDKVIKGIASGSPWPLLSEAALQLCGVAPLRVSR